MFFSAAKQSNISKLIRRKYMRQAAIKCVMGFQIKSLSTSLDSLRSYHLHDLIILAFEASCSYAHTRRSTTRVSNIVTSKILWPTFTIGWTARQVASWCVTSLAEKWAYRGAASAESKRIRFGSHFANMRRQFWLRRGESRSSSRIKHTPLNQNSTVLRQSQYSAS